MKLKSGTSGGRVVAVVTWYEQAGAVGLGTVGLGLLAVLAGVGTFAVAALGGLWPVFDIASHFALHAFGAVIGGFLAIFLVWTGCPRLGFASLVVIACATVAAPVAVARFSTWDVGRAASPAPDTLRVVSLNTWHFNQTPEKMVSFLEAVNADIVVLAEFGPLRVRFLRRLRHTYPYQFGCAQIIYCSMQLLSRHPFQDTRTLSRHVRSGPPTVMATFGRELAGLRIVGVHLMRPIDSYYGSYRETAQIADLAKGVTGPIVVAGDFNLTGWSWNLSMFRTRSGLKHMGRFLPSWPAQPRGRPQLAIDHMFASPEIMFERVELGPSVGSDHRPLVVDIRLPSGED